MLPAVLGSWPCACALRLRFALAPALALAFARAPRKVPQQTPEASKMEPRRGQNRPPRAPKSPPGGLRGPLGRKLGARWPQERSGSALGSPPEAQKTQWRSPGGPPREQKQLHVGLPGKKGGQNASETAPRGGSGGSFWQAFWALRRGSLKSWIFIDVELFCVAFGACIFLRFLAYFCLLAARPAAQQTLKNDEKPLVFVGRKASARFSLRPEQARILEHRRARNS